MVVVKNITRIVGFVILLLCSTISSCVSSSDNGNLNEETEDSSIVDTTIESATFKNPILNEGADPWVFKSGDEYLVTYTKGNNITLLRTNKI